jgi:serine/threonine-protein kinase RsbW
MAEPRWTWHREFVIPSKAEAAREVNLQILDQLRRLAWSEQDVFGVQLALEEALANAIKHGNQLDEQKSVRVSCRVANDLLRVEVADEGAGFDPALIPDPTEEGHIDVPSGRGIMLMRNFMSRVEYDRSGTRVTLEKRSSKQQANS